MPTVGIYLPLYDYGNDYLKRKLGASRDLERLAPLASPRSPASSRSVRRAVRRALDLVPDQRGRVKRLQRGSTGDRSGVWTSLSDAARGGARSADGKSGGGGAVPRDRDLFRKFPAELDAAADASALDGGRRWRGTCRIPRCTGSRWSTGRRRRTPPCRWKANAVSETFARGVRSEQRL